MTHQLAGRRVPFRFTDGVEQAGTGPRPAAGAGRATSTLGFLTDAVASVPARR